MTEGEVANYFCMGSASRGSWLSHSITTQVCSKSGGGWRANHTMQRIPSDFYFLCYFFIFCLSLSGSAPDTDCKTTWRPDKKCTKETLSIYIIEVCGGDLAYLYYRGLWWRPCVKQWSVTLFAVGKWLKSVNFNNKCNAVITVRLFLYLFG